MFNKKLYLFEVRLTHLDSFKTVFFQEEIIKCVINFHRIGVLIETPSRNNNEMKHLEHTHEFSGSIRPKLFVDMRIHLSFVNAIFVLFSFRSNCDYITFLFSQFGRLTF